LFDLAAMVKRMTLGAEVHRTIERRNAEGKIGSVELPRQLVFRARYIERIYEDAIARMSAR
jgi:hypothetical protein